MNSNVFQDTHLLANPELRLKFVSHTACIVAGHTAYIVSGTGHSHHKDHADCDYKYDAVVTPWYAFSEMECAWLSIGSGQDCGKMQHTRMVWRHGHAGCLAIAKCQSRGAVRIAMLY